MRIVTYERGDLLVGMGDVVVASESVELSPAFFREEPSDVERRSCLVDSIDVNVEPKSAVDTAQDIEFFDDRTNKTRPT